MVGNTWRDGIVGAVEAGLRARWLDRDGRASRAGHAHRFIAVRSLSYAYLDRRSAAHKPEVELIRESIDANLASLHASRWEIEEGRLRQAVANAHGAERATVTRALADHYDTRDQPETSRVALIDEAMASAEARYRI